MDASALSNITQAEFESNVEKAIQELPPDPFEERLGSELAPPPPRTSSPMPDVTSAQRGEADSPALIREPGLSLPDATRQFLMRGTDSVERMVSRPLNAIGRIFDQLADDTDEIEQEAQQQGTPRGNVAPGRARQQQYSSTPTPYAFAGPTSPGTPSAAARERQQGLYANERMSPRQIEEEIDRQHAQQRAATLEVRPTRHGTARCTDTMTATRWLRIDVCRLCEACFRTWRTRCSRWCCCPTRTTSTRRSSACSRCHDTHHCFAFASCCSLRAFCLCC